MVRPGGGAEPMKLCLLLPPVPDDRWVLAGQVGVRHAVTKVNPTLSGVANPWRIDRLRVIQRRFADAGITLLGLEGDPFDLDRVKWGQAGWQEDVDHYRELLASMGELGLDLLCYNFMPRPAGAGHDWHRTRLDVPTRGGARTTAFDLADLPPVAPGAPRLGGDELAANHDRFLDAVLPVAAQHGVRMALHPDDPPLPELQGVSRLFHCPEAFDRVFAARPDPHNAITFCQANFKLMGADVAALARRWIAAGRVAFVHVRDVAGTRERFTETFHDQGPTDLAAMLKLYHDAGFEGPIRPDHVPLLFGEAEPSMPGYGILGRLHAVGYLRGLCEAQGIELE